MRDLNSLALFFMRPLPEDKTDHSSVPCSLQHIVLESLAMIAVMPHRQIAIAIRFRWGTPCLHPIHASPALEPANARKACVG